ncbi:uncharacterized protein LOC143235139 isoform X2 [Tachypleus tridentatus]|uniref:uncharacterized protein LOC143235139 isoform X2 n=1 Tax=Tachypleus tridentatus TaxID=6853 RepID=UPI003FD4D28E
MTTLKTECSNFSANIFNKSKCQHCFKTKESHSEEALENNRATRKVSKCSYLFVAPDLDFSVPSNRTKRWQWRWFVLYDDGELTFSVDEHPSTVPQAVIDMNKVLEVTTTEDAMGSHYSLAIRAPEKDYFIKGTSQEETTCWFNVLSSIARSTVRGKTKRFPLVSHPKPFATSAVSQQSNQAFTTISTYNCLKNFTTENASPVTPCDQPSYSLAESANNVSQLHNADQLPYSKTPSPALSHTKQFAKSQKLIVSPLTQLLSKGPSVKTVVHVHLSQTPLIKQMKSPATEFFQPVTPLAKVRTCSRTSSEKSLRSQSNLVDQSSSNCSLVSQMSAVQPETQKVIQFSNQSSSNCPLVSHMSTVQPETRQSIQSSNQSSSNCSLVSQMSTVRSETTQMIQSQNAKKKEEISPQGRRSNILEKSYVCPSVGKLVSYKSLLNQNQTSVLTAKQNFDTKNTERIKTAIQNKSEYDHTAVHISEGSMLQNGVKLSRDISQVDKQKDMEQPCSGTREANFHNNPLYLLMSGVPKSRAIESVTELKQEDLSPDIHHHFSDNQEECSHSNRLERSSSGTNIRSVDWDTAVDRCQLKTSSYQNTKTPVCRRHLKSQNARPDYCSQVRWDPDGCVLDTCSPLYHTADTEHDSEKLVKKGWLMYQHSNEWHKHWVVLSASFLVLYHDLKAEMANAVDERVDIRLIKSIDEAEARKIYPFTVKTLDGQIHMFSTITAGMRSNWLQALHHVCKMYLISPMSTSTTPPVKFSSNIFSPRQQEKSFNKTFLSDTPSRPDNFNKIKQPTNPHSRSLPKAASRIKEKTKSQSLQSKISNKHDKLIAPISVYQGLPLGKIDHHNKVLTSRDCGTEFQPWRQINLSEDCTKFSICPEVASCSDVSVLTPFGTPILYDKDNGSKNKYLSRKRLENGYSLVTIKPDLDFDLQNADASHKDCKENSQCSGLKHDDYRQNNEIPTKIPDAGEFTLKMFKQQMADRKGLFVEKEADNLLTNNKILVIEDLRAFFHLCLDRLLNLKKKLGSSLERKDEAFIVGKEIFSLCSEIEKILALNDMKLTSESKTCKSENAIIEFQSACSTKLVEVEKLDNKISSLKSVLNDRDQDLMKVRTQVGSLEKEKMCLKDRVKQLEMVLRTSSCDESFAKGSKSLSEENTHLKLLLNKANETTKSLRKRLQENSESFTNLEINNYQLEQDIRQFQSEHSSQIALMIARVEDLTTKLATAEKNLRYLKQKLAKAELRQEKQKNSFQEKEGINLSKELEIKLEDLESKIGHIETCLGSRNTNDEDGMTFKSETKSNQLDLLTRLNNLESKVKAACSIVNGWSIKKPKILFPRSCDTEDVQEESGTMSASDWSLKLCSMPTKVTTDDTLLSVSSCIKTLFQKVKMVMAWMKDTFLVLQKQNSMTKGSKGSANELAHLTRTCQYLLSSEEKDENIKINLIYLLLVLQEITVAAIKISEVESLKRNIIFKEVYTMHKLVCAFENKLCSDSCSLAIDYNSRNFSFLFSFPSLFSNLNTSVSDSVNSLEDTISQDHLETELMALQEQWKKVKNLVDKLRDNKIITLVKYLKDTQVQRLKVEGTQKVAKRDSCIESTFSEELIFAEMYLLIICFSEKSYKQFLSMFQRCGFLSLYFESKAFEAWNSSMNTELGKEIESIFVQIKTSCLEDEISIRIQSSSEEHLLNQQVMQLLVEITDMCVVSALLQGSTAYCTERVNSFKADNSREPISSNHTNLLHDTLPENLYKEAVKMVTIYSPFSLSKEELVYSHDGHSVIVERLARFHSLNLTKLNERYVEEITKVRTCYQEELKKACLELKYQQQKVDCLCTEAESYQEVTQQQQETTCSTCKEVNTKLEETYEEQTASLEDEKKNVQKQLQAIFNDQVKTLENKVLSLQNELQLTQTHLRNLKNEYEEKLKSLMKAYQQKVKENIQEISEEEIRQHYQDDLSEWKKFTERSLNVLKKSYKRMLQDLQDKHRQEVERLKTEKDEALQEEARATKTALDAIRRAYQERLQREVDRCKNEWMKQNEWTPYFESLYKEHRDSATEVRKEMLSLSEKYSIKCLENATLKEHLEAVYHQNEEENFRLLDLLVRSTQLRTHFSSEISESTVATQERPVSKNNDSSKSVDTPCLELPLKAEGRIQELETSNQNITHSLYSFVKTIVVDDMQGSPLLSTNS